MKDNIKKWLPVFLMVIGIVLFAGGLIATFTRGGNDKQVVKTSLKDDFYTSVNEDKISKVNIPTDNNSWSTFYDAQVMVNTKKSVVLKKILSNPDYTNENYEIMSSLFEDYETRNKIGLGELQDYLDAIDKVQSIEELNTVMFKVVYDLNESALVNFTAEVDINNNSKKVLIFTPAKVEDIFEVYTLDKYAKYKEAYIKFRTNVLKQYGYSDEKIQDVNNKIEAFIEKIQAKSKTLSDITDITKLYNYYTIDDIKANFHNLPMMQILETYHLDNLGDYVFYDMDHMIAVDEAYTNENLEVIKEIEKIRILENTVVTITTEDYLQLLTDFQNEVQGISYDLDDMKLYLSNKIKEAFVGDDLYAEYEKSYFTEEDKNVIRELIEEIKEYYKTIINEADWLEDSTREEAIKKIDNLKINIGYKETVDNYNLKLVSKENGGTLISNEIVSNRNSADNIYKEFEEGNTQTKFDDLAVNAYYKPAENSINFPAAFYELANGTDSYYEKLAMFGSIIGHEISHAFDINGSQFDENGNLRNWWTETDKAKYEELTKKIVDYYSKYELMGLKIDGEKTLSENIADLAGMKAILAVAAKHNATNDDYKVIFESYAKLWATKIEKDNLEKQILTDEHAPNQIRVNAVLSSMDKFYEVYDIKEGDKMYVAPEDRVGIW